MVRGESEAPQSGTGDPALVAGWLMAGGYWTVAESSTAATRMAPM